MGNTENFCILTADDTSSDGSNNMDWACANPQIKTEELCRLGIEGNLREGGSANSLPILATANDVRELVQYLKKRPNGVSISNVAQPLRKRIFYPKKVSAYEFWGIATRKGEHLQLTPLGWEFARRLEPEALIYRILLAGTPFYHAALRWMLEQEMDVFSNSEVAEYWKENYPEGLDDDRTSGGSVVCFFHLCQAAELGTMTIGKRGHPARIRILRDELSAYFSSTSTQ